LSPCAQPRPNATNGSDETIRRSSAEGLLESTLSALGQLIFEDTAQQTPDDMDTVVDGPHSDDEGDGDDPWMLLFNQIERVEVNYIVAGIEDRFRQILNNSQRRTSLGQQHQQHTDPVKITKAFLAYFLQQQCTAYFIQCIGGSYALTLPAHSFATVMHQFVGAFKELYSPFSKGYTPANTNAWEILGVSDDSMSIVVNYAWDDILFFVSGMRHYLVERFPYLQAPPFSEIVHEEIQRIVFELLGGIGSCLAASLHTEKNARFKLALRACKLSSLLDLGVKAKHHLCTPNGAMDSVLLQRSESCQSYALAIKTLREMDSTPTPWQKLVCLVATSKAIVQCIRVYYQDVEGGKVDIDKMANVASDELVPIFAFVLSEALTDHSSLPSQVELMDKFILEHHMNGEEGYCLATLHSVIYHIEHQFSLRVS